ncbi:MAG: T9SS type A sorting domain-containing protein [Bacteroidetes bacterium]|nr:T9SS type A sorting domain-containing protein [Bacteroidota bacterium]
MVQYPPLGGTTLIELLNVSGQVLQTISVPALEKHTYDMQQQQIKLPAEKGLYFIKITTGVSKASTVKKVVVN